MDATQFDVLARRFAERRLSRRAAMGGAVAGLLAALGLRRDAEAQVTQAQCGNTTCKNNPGKCNDGCVCCVYGNGNSRCRPPGTCDPGTAVCPPGEVADPVAGCVTTTTTTTTTTQAPTTTTTTTTTTPVPGPFQGTCAAGANTCAVFDVLLCNGATVGDPNPCQCYQTTAGATICGQPAPGFCEFCDSDADCATITGIPNAACIALTSAICPACSDTGGTACFIPCPLPT